MVSELENLADKYPRYAKLTLQRGLDMGASMSVIQVTCYCSPALRRSTLGSCSLIASGSRQQAF